MDTSSMLWIVASILFSMVIGALLPGLIEGFLKKKKPVRVDDAVAEFMKALPPARPLAKSGQHYLFIDLLIPTDEFCDQTYINEYYRVARERKSLAWEDLVYAQAEGVKAGIKEGRRKKQMLLDLTASIRPLLEEKVTLEKEVKE